MTCDDLTRFIDGEMTEGEAVEFRAHLKSCATCQGEMPDQIAIDSRMRQLKPQSERLERTDKK